MSSPQRQSPPREVQGRPACMCATGDACSQFAPGHALHLIQARLAAATPSDWTDALVESVDLGPEGRAGDVGLRDIDTGERSVVWTAAAASVRPGEPVSLHARYGVLAIGARRLNVARL